MFLLPEDNPHRNISRNILLAYRIVRGCCYLIVDAHLQCHWSVASPLDEQCHLALDPLLAAFLPAPWLLLLLLHIMQQDQMLWVADNQSTSNSQSNRNSNSSSNRQQQQQQATATITVTVTAPIITAQLLAQAELSTCARQALPPTLSSSSLASHCSCSCSEQRQLLPAVAVSVKAMATKAQLSSYI